MSVSVRQSLSVCVSVCLSVCLSLSLSLSLSPSVRPSASVSQSVSQAGSEKRHEDRAGAAATAGGGVLLARRFRSPAAAVPCAREAGAGAHVHAPNMPRTTRRHGGTAGAGDPPPPPAPEPTMSHRAHNLAHIQGGGVWCGSPTRAQPYAIVAARRGATPPARCSPRLPRFPLGFCSSTARRSRAGSRATCG